MKNQYITIENQRAALASISWIILAGGGEKVRKAIIPSREAILLAT
jgi:hypothetical protein